MDAASSVVETAVEAAAGAAETTMGAAADAVADAAEEVLAEFTTVTMTTTTTTLMPSMGSLILMVLFVFAAAYFVTNYFLGGSLIGPKRTIALLVGPAGSGKTTLMKQLQFGKAPPGTVTSVIPNEEDCKISAGDQEAESSVRVVDFPGHVKLRSGSEEYLKRALKIVFVVDALVFNQNDRVREAVSFLFDIMTSASVRRDRVPIFIACNKSDRMNAFSPEFVKKRLEKEIDVLLTTVGDLSDTKGAEDEEVAIAKTEPGVAFKFAQALCPVTTGPVSGLKGNTKALKPFLAS